MKISLLSKTISLTLLFILAISLNTVYAQKFVYDDAWTDAGFKLSRSATTGLEVTFSMDEISLSDFDLKGEAMKEIQMKGSFLPNNEGAPNLPGNGRFIAVPRGATVNYKITAQRIETYQNVNIAPSPRIPKVTDEGPLHYEKNLKIYSQDAFYPAEPITMSELTNIRGMDAVVLGITPFQYNPISKELKVYRDLKIEVSFSGGDGTFGEDRLRSRWFDPIISDMVMNYESLTDVNYPQYDPKSPTPDYEYLIITPDDPTFISWAETLAMFRNQQGIRTGIFTTTDIGGNTTTAIEGFVDDAYANWAIPPVAVLLLGDFGTTGNTVISPIYNSYCASDNIYADVSGNHMPDVVFARMTAQNETQLETMVTKVINYETDPPTNPDFYNYPITALGWQTERWFQICSETVGGYFKTVHGKEPVRINEIYSGIPGSVWSSSSNTDMVVDYFGPDGVGYIPETPAELGGWAGGNANDIINALNNGAFLLQHRDHGSVTGWGEPRFENNDINSLMNTDLSFIFSINCLTGKFNVAGECFTEKFHRHTYGGENAGALGLLAASEVSYSFVNDTYVWGVFDNMWPDFMPDYQTEPAPRGLLPAFGNAAGKYFLEQSAWPWNTENKKVTYYLFHHHGCAFSTLYSEVPMNMTINHDNVILAGLDEFHITANDGAFVALSVNGEIIGTGTATGGQVIIPIIPQIPPTVVDVVVTKTNYYRYHTQVDVIPPTGPYIIQNDVTINDAGGNNNGQIDFGESILLSLEVKNVGDADGENVEVILSTDDPYIAMTANTANYGTVASGSTKQINDGFAFDVANDIPDFHNVKFYVDANNGTTTWQSSFNLTGHSTNLSYLEYYIDDAAGNGNGRLDPGETVDLNIIVGNSGSAPAYEVAGDLSGDDPNLTINTPSQSFGEIAANSDATQSYSINASITTSPGTIMDFTLDIAAQGGFTAQGLFGITVGQRPVLIIDLDGNTNSGPVIQEAIQELGIGVDTATNWPPNAESYSNIFVCLGGYPNNHILTEPQGAKLAAYLEAGGNLYMEGGDTWFYNTQTAVHPMFSIEAYDDGDGDLDQLAGMTGTFTEGMSFNYAGDNEWIDRIGALAPAVNIFENNFPEYYTAVANDGDGYKTIGSSSEFGGLANGSGISNRTQLMKEYLNFFNLRKVVDAPDMPEGDTTVCPGTSNIQYITSAVIGADAYYWTIHPENAGTISGTGTEITITWSTDFNGLAYVKVCGLNNTGVGPTSDSLKVTAMEIPGQAATPTGPLSVNTDETLTSVYNTTGSTQAIMYTWIITPEEAYTNMNIDNTQCTVTWAYPYTGTVDIKVKGLNECGGGEFSELLSVALENTFGLDELAKTFGISIYPNPNKGSFTLEMATPKVDKVNLRIMNATGYLVYEQRDLQVSNNFSTNIDVSGEAEGLYLMVIESDLGLFTGRIIIQK